MSVHHFWNRCFINEYVRSSLSESSKSKKLFFYSLKKSTLKYSYYQSTFFTIYIILITFYSYSNKKYTTKQNIFTFPYKKFKTYLCMLIYWYRCMIGPEPFLNQWDWRKTLYDRISQRLRGDSLPYGKCQRSSITRISIIL